MTETTGKRRDEPWQTSIVLFVSHEFEGDRDLLPAGGLHEALQHLDALFAVIRALPLEVLESSDSNVHLDTLGSLGGILVSEAHWWSNVLAKTQRKKG